MSKAEEIMKKIAEQLNEIKDLSYVIGIELPPNIENNLAMTWRGSNGCVIFLTGIFTILPSIH